MSTEKTTTPCTCGCPLALYVLEGDWVLEDYTSGMVVELACCEREAWRLMEAKDRLAAMALSQLTPHEQEPPPKRSLE